MSVKRECTEECIESEGFRDWKRPRLENEQKDFIMPLNTSLEDGELPPSPVSLKACNLQGEQVEKTICNSLYVGESTKNLKGTNISDIVVRFVEDLNGRERAKQVEIESSASSNDFFNDKKGGLDVELPTFARSSCRNVLQRGAGLLVNLDRSKSDRLDRFHFWRYDLVKIFGKRKIASDKKKKEAATKRLTNIIYEKLVSRKDFDTSRKKLANESLKHKKDNRRRKRDLVAARRNLKAIVAKCSGLQNEAISKSLYKMGDAAIGENNYKLENSSAGGGIAAVSDAACSSVSSTKKDPVADLQKSAQAPTEPETPEPPDLGFDTKTEPPISSNISSIAVTNFAPSVVSSPNKNSITNLEKSSIALISSRVAQKAPETPCQGADLKPEPSKSSNLSRSSALPVLSNTGKRFPLVRVKRLTPQFLMKAIGFKDGLGKKRNLVAKKHKMRECSVSLLRLSLDDIEKATLGEGKRSIPEQAVATFHPAENTNSSTMNIEMKKIRSEETQSSRKPESGIVQVGGADCSLAVAQKRKKVSAGKKYCKSKTKASSGPSQGNNLAPDSRAGGGSHVAQSSPSVETVAECLPPCIEEVYKTKTNASEAEVVMKVNAESEIISPPVLAQFSDRRKTENFGEVPRLTDPAQWLHFKKKDINSAVSIIESPKPDDLKTRKKSALAAHVTSAPASKSSSSQDKAVQPAISGTEYNNNRAELPTEAKVPLSAVCVGDIKSKTMLVSEEALAPKPGQGLLGSRRSSTADTALSSALAVEPDNSACSHFNACPLVEWLVPKMKPVAGISAPSRQVLCGVSASSDVRLSGVSAPPNQLEESARVVAASCSPPKPVLLFPAGSPQIVGDEQKPTSIPAVPGEMEWSSKAVLVTSSHAPNAPVGPQNPSVVQLPTEVSVGMELSSKAILIAPSATFRAEAEESPVGPKNPPNNMQVTANMPTAQIAGPSSAKLPPATSHDGAEPSPVALQNDTDVHCTKTKSMTSVEIVSSKPISVGSPSISGEEASLVGQQNNTDVQILAVMSKTEPSGTTLLEVSSEQVSVDGQNTKVVPMDRSNSRGVAKSITECTTLASSDRVGIVATVNNAPKFGASVQVPSNVPITKPESVVLAEISSSVVTVTSYAGYGKHRDRASHSTVTAPSEDKCKGSAAVPPKAGTVVPTCAQISRSIIATTKPVDNSEGSMPSKAGPLAAPRKTEGKGNAMVSSSEPSNSLTCAGVPSNQRSHLTCAGVPSNQRSHLSKSVTTTNDTLEADTASNLTKLGNNGTSSSMSSNEFSVSKRPVLNVPGSQVPSTSLVRESDSNKKGGNVSPSVPSVTAGCQHVAYPSKPKAVPVTSSLSSKTVSPPSATRSVQLGTKTGGYATGSSSVPLVSGGYQQVPHPSKTVAAVMSSKTFSVPSSTRSMQLGTSAKPISHTLSKAPCEQSTPTVTKSDTGVKAFPSLPVPKCSRTNSTHVINRDANNNPPEGEKNPSGVTVQDQDSTLRTGTGSKQEIRNSAEDTDKEGKKDSVSSSEKRWGMPNPGYDFVSTDPAENADNFNTGWDALRNVTNDAERYRRIRQRWRNLAVPDPAKNLTFRHRRPAQAPAEPRRRPPQPPQPARRHQRSFSCTSLYELMIEKARIEAEKKLIQLEEKQRQEEQLLLASHRQLLTFNNMDYTSDDWNYFGPQRPPQFQNLIYQQTAELNTMKMNHASQQMKIHEEREAEIRHYQQYMEEVRTFHFFYQGLDVQTAKCDKMILTPEQVELVEETERIYDAFHKVYRSN